jgi:hypothetical protein
VATDKERTFTSLARRRVLESPRNQQTSVILHSYMSNLFAAFIVLLLAACGDPSTIKDPHAKAPSPAARTNALSPEAAGKRASDDSALRRTYGISDIKLATCLTLLEDGSLEGKDCENGIVTYGPYVTAPAASDLFLSFDIKAAGTIQVASDVVSHGGEGATHAAIEAVRVKAGSATHLGYNVHFFEQATDIEARISIHAKAPTSFTITDIKLAVR